MTILILSFSITQYSIIFAHSTSNIAHPMALTITKSPPEIIAVNQPVVFTAQTDYVLACRINGGITGIGDSIEPDTAHKATFEFSDYLRDLPVLNAGLTVPAVHANACPAQTFKFSERYGSPLSDHNEIETDTFRLLAARVPFWKTDYTQTIGYFVSHGNPFLTWYPNRIRKVLPAELIHLYFLHINSTPSTYSLKFNVVFTDGTSEEFEGALSAVVQQYGVVQLNAGAPVVLAWAAANYPDKTVNKYSAKACNHVEGIEVVSEVRWFSINRLPFVNPRQIFFRNSFGTFDQLMLRGLGALTSASEKLTAVQQANYSAAQVPDRVTWYTKGRHTLKVEPGYMLSYELAWLNELINSTEIYEVSGSLLLPLELRTEKFIQLDDDSPLLSVPLEFDYLQKPAIQ